MLMFLGFLNIRNIYTEYLAHVFAVNKYFIYNNSYTIKVLYWHIWFHEEPLTSMEPFHSTKGSLLRKMVL